MEIQEKFDHAMQEVQEAIKIWYSETPDFESTEEYVNLRFPDYLKNLLIKMIEAHNELLVLELKLHPNIVGENTQVRLERHCDKSWCYLSVIGTTIYVMLAMNDFILENWEEIHPSVFIAFNKMTNRILDESGPEDGAKVKIVNVMSHIHKDDYDFVDMMVKLMSNLESN